MTASVAGLACSKPPGTKDAADVSDSGEDVEDELAVVDSSPTESECLAAASVDDCEAMGCVVLSGVRFYEYSSDDGCQEVDGFICLDSDGGSDRAGFYWREREDGTVVTWSYGAMALSAFSATWESCRATFHPVCACNPAWPANLTPDMGLDSGDVADVGEQPDA